jgi:hypothetical protein
MRILPQILLLALCVCPALAEDKTFNSTLSLKVGETKQLGNFGEHTLDCSRGLLAQVEIIQAPALGVLSRRDNVDYVARNSLSHTCEGDHFLGTAMDYTAKSAGADRMRFDAVFKNGRLHFIVSVVNR